MKLLSVHVENFGKLHDYDRDFTRNINEITEENGWGKTTLSIFLLVMFYGFDDRMTKKLREKYAPWNGGAYGGSVVFEAAGKSYIIERTFGRKRTTEDRFELRDAETNLVSYDYDEYIGDELFRINTESFFRTVFMGQNGCITSTTDDINAKIGDLSMVEADMRNFSEAIGRLNDYLNRNSEQRKTGKIYGMRQEAAALRAKARFATGMKNELADCDNSIEVLQREKEELEVRKKEAVELQSNILKCKEAVLMHEKSKALVKRVKAAEDSKNEAITPDSVSGSVYYAVGVIPLLAGIPAIILDSVITGISLFALSVFLFIVGAVTEKKREQRINSEKKRRNDIYNDALHELEDFLNSVDLKEIKKLSAMPEAMLSLNDADKRRCEISDRLDHVKNELQRLISRREFLCDELASAEAAEERARYISGKADEGRERLENAERAMEILKEAKTGFSLRYLEPLKTSLCTYYGMLKGEGAAKCRLDADLTITLEECGGQREENAFSDGIRNALGLCMRFALIDAMYREEKPFIIMDDPFVHFDTATVNAAMKLLKNLPYQVILLRKK